MSVNLQIHLALASLCLALAGCGGNYGGGDSSGSSPAGGVSSAEPGGFSSSEEFFASQVGPRMDFCRTCHIPGGVADTPDGRAFMLSNNPAEDYANFLASWERLGGGAADNPILLENADPVYGHSGGQTWPEGSDAYNDVLTLLECFDDPAQCVFDTVGGGGDPVDALPLLGSSNAQHRWFSYCEGQPDNAALPADPRSLVRPGVNDGKAVYYNIWYKDCHIDPELVGEADHPKTCGELRSRWQEGDTLIRGNGVVGAGSLFAGTEPAGPPSIEADIYNSVWQSWGLSERPDNFDQLLAERWGFAFAAEPNPYPVPGEDPNATNGGSGKLPTAFTQTRNADGSWSGRIGVTCHGCHSSILGTPDEGPGFGLTSYGAGSSPHDMGVMARDLGAAGHALFGAAANTGLFGKTRGTGNPINVQAIILMTADFRVNASTVPFFTAPSAGSEDAPAWWNSSHRPVKFFDGFLPSDADRSKLGLFLPFMDKSPQPSSQQEAQDWVRAHDRQSGVWVASLTSPEYPLPVDETLAEQGAVLFHSKDLWADNLNNPVPSPPGGNGSCASCHGAYSPRFVNDPDYLATPELEGVSSYVVPLSIINTDPARTESNTDGASEYGRGNFYAYPETAGLAPEYDCGPQTHPDLREGRERGYLAPPLYGVWATAPYFHNGSVPNAREVLRSSERVPIWRRVSAPAPAGQEGQVVMGFDTSLTRAFDQEKLGWDYDPIQCGSEALPLLECIPDNPVTNAPLISFLAELNDVVGLTWNADVPPASNADVEKRKIYNTHAYSQGNSGHEFTDVLTDAEVRALIEYLKTL